MKLLAPLVIAVLGLGAGVGAGLALKPPPEERDMAAVDCVDDGHGGCAEAEVDPFRAGAEAEVHIEGEPYYVPMEKPFVVPVFDGERVVAMVVLTVSVETGADSAPAVEAVEPRLRDRFLKAMFRHANTGGFDGSFTSGQKMDDLKSALVNAAREVMGSAPVGDVLITDVARQDV
jgi:hypothetical protein